MTRETERRGLIICRKDGIWKLELKKRLKTNDSITLMALGNVKNELLRHLNSRIDIDIIKMETKYMKKREKGMGLKITVRKSLRYTHGSITNSKRDLFF